MTLSERMGRHVIRYRLAYGIATIVSTAFFAIQIPKVKVVSLLIDLFPEDHEFVETYKEYQDVFGGANTVLMSLDVKEGDVFNSVTLEKIRFVTKELELIPGINNYQVLSLAQRKVKNITVDATAGFQSIPVMWPDIPKDAAGIERLKELVHTTGRIHGTLISKDDKAALIVAGFIEEQMNVKDVYERLQTLRHQVEDENTSVHIIGRPVMLGFILEHSGQLRWLFLATVLAMIFILAVNFRDIRGVLIPMLTAIISSIWGFGFLGILDYNFDPLIVVVPFIISARALSHSVQLIERYNEECALTKDTREAAARTFAGLWEPGFVGIMADVLAILAVWFTPIPLMQKLSIMAAFWGISIIVSDLIFNPVLLSYLPYPKKAHTAQIEGVLSRFLMRVGRVCIGPRRWTILLGAGVLGVLGFLAARTVVIGDAYPGTPMLWPDSQYNRDTEAIGARFNNTDILNVIVEGDAWNAIKNPDVLNKMFFLQREMSMPEVGGTSSIADLLPPIIRAMHGGDPRWELIPTDGRESGFFLEMIYSASEPGDLSRFVTPDSRHANIAIYLKDHKGETLRKVVARLRDFVSKNPMKRVNLGLRGTAEHIERCIYSRLQDCPTIEPGARFRLAGGFAGLLAAVNEVVMRTEALVTLLAFLSVFLFCAISYRSVLAGIFFMIPLVVSNYLTYALMGIRGIGLDVNTVPIVALGVGLGVDYGLYVVSRIAEEYRARGDLGDAILTAMATAGKAVLLTAMTMVAGVVFWTFSFMRFQADMGLLLVFWMSMSMVGSLLLLPTFIWMFKPRFVLKAKKHH